MPRLEKKTPQNLKRRNKIQKPITQDLVTLSRRSQESQPVIPYCKIPQTTRKPSGTQHQHQQLWGHPDYRWAVPAKMHNRRIHAYNGNPDEHQKLRRRHSWAVHGDPRSSCSLEPLYDKWTTMLRLAQRKFKIFRLPAATKTQTKNRLQQQVKVRTSRDTWAVDMIATTICLASLPDRPIFTAALLGEKDTFKAHCVSAVAATMKDRLKKPELQSSLWTTEFEELWDLTQKTLPHIMTLTKDKLTPSKSQQQQLYKALQFQNEHCLKLWMEKNTLEPLDITGWTPSLDSAIRDATPNKGISGRMSFVQHRLRRNGYKSEAVTNIGAIAIVNARAINIGSIMPSNKWDSWWIHEPNTDSKRTWRGHSTEPTRSRHVKTTSPINPIIHSSPYSTPTC